MSHEDGELRRLLTRRGVVVGMAACLAAIAAAGVVAWRSSGYIESRQAINVPLAVSCPTLGVCALADNQGNVFWYVGGAWSKRHVVADNPINAVSCATQHACTAVDVAGSTVTLQHGRWTSRAVAPQSASDQGSGGLRGITSVSCPTATFCMAGDSDGRIYRFNGRSWSHAITVGRHFHSRGVVEISCASRSLCAAITSAQALTYRHGAWSRPVELESTSRQRTAARRFLNTLSGISCAGHTCVAVDVFGRAFVLRGEAWSNATSVDPASSGHGGRDGLTSVSCATEQFCLATDDLGDVLSFSGNAWSAPVRIDPSQLGLAAISCSTPAFCLALNHLGQALVLKGSAWSQPRTVDAVPPPER